MNIVTGGCSYSETQHCIDYHRLGIMDNYDLSPLQPLEQGQ